MPDAGHGPRRVLVTGANGFVGRHAVQALHARGFEVHAVSRAGPTGSPRLVWHAADLLSPDAAGALIAAVRPSHLLHLAWDVQPGLFWRAPDNLDWVAASLRLYRAFATHGGTHMVVTGSCAEYDWDHEWLDEATTPLRPATLYGVAKDALHRLLRAACAQDGVTLGWGRLFFLYGPGEHPSRLVAEVARALVRGEPALCGDGRALRDFMAVGDAAIALAALLDEGVDEPVNIASGNCVPVAEIVGLLGRLAERPDLVRLGARPPTDEPQRLAAAVTRLRRLCGALPSSSLEEGLAATLAWWKARENKHLRS